MVDDAGRATGISDFGGSPGFYAALWPGGRQVEPLGVFGSSDCSFALGTEDRADVVGIGTYYAGEDSEHVFLRRVTDYGGVRIAGQPLLRTLLPVSGDPSDYSSATRREPVRPVEAATMNHPTYASVASTLALLTAVGGVAYGATVTGADVVDGSLGGRDVRNGSLAEKDLAVQVLAETDLYLDARQSDKPVVVAGDESGFTTLTSAPFDVSRRSDLLVQATVGFRNDGLKPAITTYRVLVDGEVHHDFTLADGAEPGGQGLSPVSLQCNGVPAGEHTVALQVRVEQDAGGTVTFGRRSTELVGFRLIPNPP